MLYVTWLGESGFLLEDGRHALLIDPYLSNALGERRPDRHRLLPVDEGLLRRPYDLVLLTHCHIDHTDPRTLATLADHNPRLLLAGPPSSHDVLPDAPIFCELTAGNSLRMGDFWITALPAVHSDPYALGYALAWQGKTLYFSGDTALLCGLEKRVPQAPEIAFLCFNAGVGKNMDAQDAVRLAKRIGAKRVVPTHYGVLPGGVTPEDFLGLLAGEGIPSQTLPYCQRVELFE